MEYHRNRTIFEYEREMVINWVKDIDQRPIHFYKPDCEDSGWNLINVLSIWELKGYGDPIYMSGGYPWIGQSSVILPNVPIVNNHVGSYRRTFEHPQNWSGNKSFPILDRLH